MYPVRSIQLSLIFRSMQVALKSAQIKYCICICVFVFVIVMIIIFKSWVWVHCRICLHFKVPWLEDEKSIIFSLICKFQSQLHFQKVLPDLYWSLGRQIEADLPRNLISKNFWLKETCKILRIPMHLSTSEKNDFSYNNRFEFSVVVMFWSEKVFWLMKLILNYCLRIHSPFGFHTFLCAVHTC